MPEELNLVQEADELAHEAFRVLLAEGRPLFVRELAERLAIDDASIAHVLEALSMSGRAELDDEGRLLGIFGLTLKPTSHRMKLRGTTFFTWCAFDSVGIPAALRESAEITSECGHCQREIRLTIVDGVPPSAAAVISWSPRQCDSVREEFCPTVNFYCDEGHFTASTADGESTGAFLTLEAASSLGGNIWRWAAERR
jgi:alkylmercury lyase